MSAPEGTKNKKKSFRKKITSRGAFLINIMLRYKYKRMTLKYLISISVHAKRH